MDEPQRFSREFKLEAVRRMQAGENVSVLARELGVSRKSIYKWRDRYRQGGMKALRDRGGRPQTEVSPSATEERSAVSVSLEQAFRETALEEMARAQRRIAELERKIGQQQVELDFFQQALRQVREERLRSGATGGVRSTPSSKQ